MCGIVGIVTRRGSPPAPPGRLERMCDSLRHRGPDGSGSITDGTVALGMRRLAVIDVEHAVQPLLNEDRSVRVVFNGEIYNYRELRGHLEARGHRLRSDGDGEVLPHLWEEYGPAFLERLDGMFAIALHDTRDDRLLLARDHAGIKPLYWARVRDGLVFGSEVKALLRSGMVDPSVDLTAVRDFLTWEYVPAPRTLLRGTRKLEPGTLLDLDVDTFRQEIRRWWNLPERVEAGQASEPATQEEWAEHIDGLVGDSVRSQLMSDVPLGAFLSGGVDSSLVVSHMDRPRTFSIGFDDPSYDELSWSRKAAAALGARHRTETVHADVLGLFDRLMDQLDDPIGDVSIFPTYLVSRLARDEVTVALSGDGGDELFGGYETYVAQELERIWNRVPRFIRETVIARAVERFRPRKAKKGLVNKARRFVEGLRHDPRLGHARWRRFVGEALAGELFTAEAREAMEGGAEDHIVQLAAEVPPSGDDIRRALHVDQRSYLPDNCLVKVDRMSMACSLEVRVPLLSPRLMEAAYRMPSELKVRRGRTKVLLKEVAARRVPEECVYRPKEGFSIPMKHWLRSDLRVLMQDLLSEARLRDERIFRTSTVRRLVDEHLSGAENHSHVIWGLMVHQAWRDRWMR